AWTSQPDHRVLHSFPTRRSSDLAVIFHEPEPADIVRGAVAAGHRDATIRLRLGLPSDQRIEAHGTTVVEFAEHTDATGEVVTQVKTGVRVGGDGQSDGGGTGGEGCAVDPSAEAFTQHP